MLNILTQQFYFYANNINISNQQLYVKFKILKIKRLILIGDIKSFLMNCFRLFSNVSPAMS